MENKTEEKELSRDMQSFSQMEQLGEEFRDVAQRLEENVQQIYREIPETDDLDGLEKLAGELRDMGVRIGKAGARLLSVADELAARCRDMRNQRKKRGLISAAPANGTIDLEEMAGDHFARGLGIYKLLLVCFLGSFAGVVVELGWCLIRNGYLESRSGLVYGPFNLLYGAGAVALTVCLYRFRNRGTGFPSWAVCLWARWWSTCAPGDRRCSSVPAPGTTATCSST